MVTISSPESPPAALPAARRAVAVSFALHGVAAGSWAARVPWVQDHLTLSPAALGLALLGTAFGGIVAMPFAGWLTGRYGSGQTLRVALVLVAVTVALPPLAPNLGLLALALVGFGAAGGVVDVAQNSQASAIEQQYGRPIMPGLHGLWSVGALVGAAGGGAAAGAGLAAPAHLAIVAAAGALCTVLGTGGLLPGDRHEAAPAFARPSRALLLIGVIGFCSLFAEAAAADWSAVYLSTVARAGAGLAAGAYAAFSIVMAVLRLLGNGVVQRFGPAAVTRAGATVGALGLTAGLVVPRPVVSVVAFGLLGVGVAFVIPLVFSTAGSAPGRPPATSIAAVATLSYAGWLLAPALIGGVADATSLTAALGLVAALTAVIAVLAGALRLTAPAPAPRTRRTRRATRPSPAPRRREPR